MRWALAALVLLGAAACERRSAACSILRACDTCTLEGCGWCFELGECLPVASTCPGDGALTPEGCEHDEAASAADAGFEPDAR